MSEFFERLLAVFFAALEAAVGVLLLVDREAFTAWIILIFGALAAAWGLVYVVQYFRAAPSEGAKGRKLTSGLLCILCGVFCAVRADWLQQTFPVLAAAYGTALLVLGVFKVQTMADRIRLRYQNWGWSAVSALFTIACAGLSLWNPFETAEALWVFVGVCLIVAAVLDIVAVCTAKKPSPPASAEAAASQPAVPADADAASAEPQEAGP